MTICAITGSKGILGRRIKQYLPFKFYEFTDDITIYSEVKKWVEKKDFDLIIHLAAVVPTNIVEKNYSRASKVNVLGTKNLVKAIIKKKNKPKWFFFSSTSHVYEPTLKYHRIKETRKTLPYSKYGKTKKKAEEYIKKKFKKSGIKFCIGRIFSFTDKFQKEPFAIPAIKKKINRPNKKKIFVKNLNHYRDFLSTKDITRAIYRLYKFGAFGIYNIGSGKGICLKKIAELLAKKYEKKIHFIDNQKISYLVSDNTKILKIGFKYKRHKKKLEYFY